MSRLGKGALEFLTGTELRAVGAMYSDGVLTLGQPLYLTDRNYFFVGDDVALMQHKKPVQAPFIEGFIDEWDANGNFEIVNHASDSQTELDNKRYYIKVLGDTLTFKALGFKFIGAFDDANKATASKLGFVKLGNNTEFSDTFASLSVGNVYPVQTNSSGQMGVRIPTIDATKTQVNNVESGTYCIALIQQNFTSGESYVLNARKTGGITVDVNSNTLNCNISGYSNKANAFNVNSAIGGATTPVYINADGLPVACIPYSDATVNKANALNVGSAIGSNKQPVYINADGVPTLCVAYSNASVLNATNVVSGGSVTTGAITGTGNVNIANGVLQATTAGTVTVTGNLVGTGTLSGFTKVYNAVWNDYADALPWNHNTLACEAGDIIAKSVGLNQYEKATQENKHLIVGVYSDTYGHLLGGKEGATIEETLKDYLPIAVAGNVKVKVVGYVAEGDFITLSKFDGVGVAIPHGLDTLPFMGTIVGKALESKHTENIERISMQVMLL